MKIIIGLGNPGKKFQKARHNVGWRVVDEFSKKNNFPALKLSKKFSAEISEEVLTDEKIILAKPQTFMNESGKAARLLTKNYKLKTENLLVVHDDIDLPLGKIKITKNRGSAGHKGVESIIKGLKSKNFIRLRIGIKPQKTENREQRAEKFVLESFKKEEEKTIKETIDEAVGAIETVINEGLEKAQSTYNIRALE